MYNPNSALLQLRPLRVGVLLLALAGPAGALTITPSATEVGVGETFELRFSDTFTDFNGAIVEATSSPGFTLTRLYPGSGLPNGALVDPDTEFPAVIYTPALVSGQDLEFLVAEFRATAPGLLSWTFDGTWYRLLPSTGFDEEEPFLTQTVSVRVTGQSVPEGSILGLFGLGLPVLMASRSRRSGRNPAQL